jgi:uncharacterized membrane protein
MKGKILIGSLLCMIALTVMVSSAGFSIPNPQILSKSKNLTNITITNTGSTNLNLNISWVPNNIVQGDNSDILALYYSGSVVNLTPTSTETISIGLQSGPTDWNNFELGKLYSTSLIFINAVNASENETKAISVINSFCEYGEVGELSIDLIEDKKLDNEDEWAWRPLDNIKIKVNNVYNGFDKDKRVRVEYELYDDAGRKVDLDNDNYEDVKIKDGDNKDIYLEFKVPADVEEGNYKFFIKAYIKGNEDEGCVDNWKEDSTIKYYQEVTVEKEERAIVVDIHKLYETFSQQAFCGDIISVDPTIYNIGIEDEDKVLVRLYNKELGIDMKRVINDLGEGEGQTIYFDFNVPEDAEEKTYSFELTTFFEYDEDCGDDENFACYDSNSKDDLDKTFKTPLTVKGPCIKELIKNAQISAILETSEEDVKAGREVVIKATIENTGEETTDYTVGVEGNEFFSTTKSITPSTLTLEPGQSGNALITLKLNRDAEGEQIFGIKTVFDGKTVKQQVSLVIAPRFTITGSAIAETFRENWFIWAIVAINIILIIAIIVVAVKMSRA